MKHEMVGSLILGVIGLVVGLIVAACTAYTWLPCAAIGFVVGFLLPHVPVIFICLD